MSNKWQKTPYWHNYPFIFAGTYSLLHHSRIDLVMCPHKTASRWHVHITQIRNYYPKYGIVFLTAKCKGHWPTHTKWLTHFIMDHPRITQFVHRVPQFVHRVDYSTLWLIYNSYRGSKRSLITNISVRRSHFPSVANMALCCGAKLN